MASLEQRCRERKFLNNNRLMPYEGREHDLYIALPDYAELQRCFTIYFDRQGINPPVIHFRQKQYILDKPPLRTEDRGYYCIQGKFKGSKGLHKIPLHRLAYVAFFGAPPPGYHIHHIDRKKHNNAALNLVAVTEEEHSAIHGRDVSVPRNLFTKQPSRGLLASIKEEKSLAVKQIEDPLMKELELGLMEPKLWRLLNEEYSEERLDNVIQTVVRLHNTNIPRTVLEELCFRLYEQ